MTRPKPMHTSSASGAFVVITGDDGFILLYKQKFRNIINLFRLFIVIFA